MMPLCSSRYLNLRCVACDRHIGAVSPVQCTGDEKCIAAGNTCGLRPLADARIPDTTVAECPHTSTRWRPDMKQGSCQQCGSRLVVGEDGKTRVEPLEPTEHVWARARDLRALSEIIVLSKQPTADFSVPAVVAVLAVNKKSEAT